jgi:type IV pilus assembly protein PilC
VNFRDLQIYTRQFATLINAGIPVVDSLRILTNGLRPGLLKDASSLIKSSIEGGNRLSEAMAKSPSVFDRLYCNMVQAGEEAGILDTIMLRLAMYIEKNEKIKRQVKGALIYPASILVVASLVVVIIMVFVIPKFMEFFISNGAELPWLTSVVVTISNALINQWYLFVGGAIGIPYFINRVLQTPAGKNQFDRLMYDAPIFGELIQKSAIARLSRTLSTLLTAGVGMIEALDISSRTSGNIVVETALAKARDSVKAGRTLAAPLSRDKVFPDMVVQMISIGEQSGTLEKMLEKIADFYEDEVEVAAEGFVGEVHEVGAGTAGGAAFAFVGVAGTEARGDGEVQRGEERQAEAPDAEHEHGLAPADLAFDGGEGGREAAPEKGAEGGIGVGGDGGEAVFRADGVGR